jgi:hypothetical protein
MVALNNISTEYKNSALESIISGKEKQVWSMAVVVGVDPADLGDSYTPGAEDTSIHAYEVELARFLEELAALKAGVE